MIAYRLLLRVVNAALLLPFIGAPLRLAFIGAVLRSVLVRDMQFLQSCCCSKAADLLKAIALYVKLLQQW